MGRAARHINGTAILYADKITKSMRRAMDETDRRRNIQLAHNKANNISPRGVQKAVKSLIEVGEAVSEDAPNKTRDWRRMSETQLAGNCVAWKKKCTPTPIIWSLKRPPKRATKFVLSSVRYWVWMFREGLI